MKMKMDGEQRIARMCVREERAKELFYKRKNKNPKKPKPQTRDSPQTQKAPHKKKKHTQ